MNKLETIALQNNQSANQLAKKALIEWIEILFSSRNLDMIIFPKKSLIKIISFLSTEEIEEIAKEVAENLNEYFEFLFKTHRKHFSEETFYQILSRFLGPSGTMWFDHLEFDFQNALGRYFFQGMHKSGKNWSIFTGVVLQEILGSNFDLKIKKKSLQNGQNSLQFEFLKK